MFHVVLFEPEIPPNTGNIIRLCSNCGAHLHLVEPLGFELDDRKLRRAGLDYHEFARITRHHSVDGFLAATGVVRMFTLSTRNATPYDRVNYSAGDAFLFGPETRGLPPSERTRVDSTRRLKVPMRPGNRSLNLANCVAIVVYEAWRQLAFAGADRP